MEYRPLGRTGVWVSVISLGTEYLFEVPRQQAIDVVRQAVDQGINYFDLFYAQPADGAERDFSSALAEFGEFQAGECVYCNHCLPCPAGIDIGAVMRLLSRARARPSRALRDEYDALPANGADCTHCGACVSRCPFGVDPTSGMEDAERLLAGL